MGRLQHTGTSSRCPGTRTGLPHYSRCSWAQPAQNEPSDTPGERPGDLRQGRETALMNTGVKCVEPTGGVEVISPLLRTQHMFSVILDMLGFAYGFIYTALFHSSRCKSLLGFTSALRRHPWKKVTEWLKLNSLWHSDAAVISLPGNRHCDNSIRNWGSSIMDAQPCKWILFSGLWTKTELTESRLS